MQAKLVDSIRPRDWIYEVKFDGYRALALRGGGEIVALDEKGRSSFQLLQGFDMGQERPPVFFYAFDLLRLNGKDLQNLSIEERTAKLEELFKQPGGAIRIRSVSEGT